MNHKENKYFHDADKTQTKPFFYENSCKSQLSIKNRQFK